MGKDLKLTASDNFQTGAYRASYDKACADIAWPRSMAFFAKHLK